MASEEHDVLLLIADISGYTRFVAANQTELAHSHKVISALLEAILAEVELPLRVAKLEGDAVFCYAIMDDEAASLVRHKLSRFYDAFSAKRRQLAESWICACGACCKVSDLRLKIIVHRGKALIYSIVGRTELAGVDVIIAHRLLKNSIAFDEYILLTEASTRDFHLDLPVLASTTEECDGIGPVDVVAYRPAVHTGAEANE